MTPETFELLRLGGNMREAQKLYRESLTMDGKWKDPSEVGTNFWLMRDAEVAFDAQCAALREACAQPSETTATPDVKVYSHTIAQWLRLFEHATEGPWHVEALHDDGEPGEVWMICHNSTVDAQTTVVNTFSHTDAKAIAASRVAVPLLCARVLELEAAGRKVLSDIDGRLAQWNEHGYLNLNSDEVAERIIKSLLWDALPLRDALLPPAQAGEGENR